MLTRAAFSAGLTGWVLAGTRAGRAADAVQLQLGAMPIDPSAEAFYGQDQGFFRGAGLDVMLANTAGDRLIDWSGEFNSYLVPFDPFGMPTISREPSPGLLFGKSALADL